MEESANPDTYKESTAGFYYSQTPGLEVVPQPPSPPKIYEQTFPQSQQAHEPTICGLRRVTFFLSVALAIVILAAAIGGGVGGSLAVQSAKSSCTTTKQNSTAIGQSLGPTVTTTVTTTITAAAASTTGPLVVPTGVVALDCPGINNTEQVTTLDDDSWVFTPLCGVDYEGSDFGAVIVYSFNDCLEACAAHNHYSGNTSCTALTFRANQTEEIPENYGNCWLKYGTPSPVSVGSNLVAGALLKSAPTS
ncbi:hypothetical protein F5Y16DRAFT_370290 [Xylariaceae sp. FL0255]|nr:hypothetical protein F5Y16DRAFT_370290 [Xylariaceae sp. FL0255]